MKIILYILAISLCAFSTAAQDRLSEKLEIEIKDGYHNHNLYEFGKSGVVIKSQKKSSDKKGTVIQYEKRDTDLQYVEAKSISIPKEQSNIKTVSTEEGLHTLGLSRQGTFTLLSLDHNSFDITSIEGMLPKNLWLLDLVVLGDLVYGRATRKKEHYIYTINWKTGKTKINPMQIEGYSNIRRLNLQVLKNSEEVIGYYSSVRNLNKTVVHAVILNKDGDIVNTLNLSEGIDKNIISISTTKTEDATYLFVGSYSTENVDSSEGIFSYTWSEGKAQQIEYHNYIDLKHFTSYFDEFKQRYIELKKKTKAKKGEALSLNYQLAEHDLIPIEEGYIFIAEAYFKVYEQNLTTSRAYVPEGSTSSHADDPSILYKGNQYTHLIICRLDNTGRILWNETLELNPTYRPRSQKRFVSIIHAKQNEIEFGYCNQGNLSTRTYDFDGQVLHDHSIDFSTYASNAKHWYDRYFISYSAEAATQKKKGNVLKIIKLNIE